jgi:predicted esterase YcpF (UPF0227 family)
MSIYYIHGYESSPEGKKGVLFREKLNAKAIKYRDCEPKNIQVSECLKRIFDAIKNDEEVILIGSSFGGFLAAETAFEHRSVKKLILLNPAIIPPYMDLECVQIIPREIAEDMMDRRLFENRIDAEIIILRGTKDEVVPDEWVIEFAKAQEATVLFLEDDHTFSSNLKKLPAIISLYVRKNILRNQGGCLP